MKLLFAILFIPFTLTSFAAVSPGNCEDNLNLFNEVIGLVNEDNAVKKMEITEMAEITFVVYADQSIHVLQVLTKDYLFEYHIRQQLEGVKVDQCFDNNRTYTVLVNAKLV